MKLTFIDCSCGNTKGFQLADKLAECTSCAQPVHIDTPVYHTYEVESLNKIEQRAKEQAIIDMCDEPLHNHYDGCPDCEYQREPSICSICMPVETQLRRVAL